MYDLVCTSTVTLKFVVENQQSWLSMQGSLTIPIYTPHGPTRFQKVHKKCISSDLMRYGISYTYPRLSLEVQHDLLIG